jgi:probable phosphoglycerate mutase
MSSRSIVLVRHGETEWSRTGKHTGRTDVPLTDRGREEARAIASRLASFHFQRVLASPLVRAFETCQIAGFGDRAEKTEVLLEWDYGEYEGLTTPDIRAKVPGWNVFTHGCPGGETPAAIARRVDRLIAELLDTTGDVLLFAHGHVLRVLTARWLELGPEAGRLFALETARLSILGFERETRVIMRWNA